MPIDIGAWCDFPCPDTQTYLRSNAVIQRMKGA